MGEACLTFLSLRTDCRQELDSFTTGLVENLYSSALATLALAALNLATDLFLVLGACCQTRSV